MWKWTGTLALSALIASSASAAEVLYSTARAGVDLIKIDPITAQIQVVGTLGLGSVAIASAPDGSLYTVTEATSPTGTNSQLAKVDPKTGAATLLGTPWGRPIGAVALGVGPDGTIYAGGLIENKLFRVDPTTGVPTEIGTFQGGRNIQDFAFHPKSGEMYAVRRATLYRVDPGTARLTEIVPITQTNPIIEGIEFTSDGTLYATTLKGAFGKAEAPFYRVDLETGIGQLVGNLATTAVHGAAVVEEP
jgi:streptogramin lyase